MTRNAIRLKAGLILGLVAGCGPAPDLESPGDTAFQNYCAPCHLADGQGVEGGGPPLANSSWVRGPESRLIRIVLHGLRGPIQVGGQIYDREMLAFGPILSDQEIAEVLTFARRRFGRGAASITPAAVGQVRRESGDRSEYWRAEELLRFR